MTKIKGFARIESAGAPHGTRARKLHRMDRILGAFDQALRTLFAKPRGTRPCPIVPAEATHMGEQERKHAAALMRVNHVGEICAQALYTAQAMTTRNEAL